MKSSALLLLCFLTLMLIKPAPVHAHGGGLDKNRCHNEYSTGRRHCHPRKSCVMRVVKGEEDPRIDILQHRLDVMEIRVRSIEKRIHALRIEIGHEGVR